MTGFQLWVPLTAEQSRNYLKLYLGWKLEDFPDLKDMVERGTLSVDNLVSERKTANPADLMRYIIAGKSRTRPTISTDLDTTCGGYTGYIYTIHGRVIVRDWNTAVPGIKLTPKGMWPNLYLDTDSLDTATKIGVKNKHGIQELTYFTPIPRNELAECRLNGTVVAI